MYDYFYRIYMAITENTSSDLIFFFVILGIVITPAYVYIFRDRKAKRQHDREKQGIYAEREKEIVTVIKEMSEKNNDMARDFSAVVAENTAVISTLKDLIKNQGAESKLATARIHEKLEQVTGRLHERIDGVAGDASVIKSDISAIKADTATIKELLKMAESWWRK